MRISAKADYAVRATLELSVSPDGSPVKGTKLAEAQDIPLQFLEHILLDLKRAGIVRTKRGARGGYWLSQPAKSVTVADIIRAVDGPLAYIQDLPPEETRYGGAAVHLREVWIATRQTLREVLEQTSLAQIASGELPKNVTDLLKEPGAFVARGDTGSHPTVT